MFKRERILAGLDFEVDGAPPVEFIGVESPQPVPGDVRLAELEARFGKIRNGIDKGFHRVTYLLVSMCYGIAATLALVAPKFEMPRALLEWFFHWLWVLSPSANFLLSTALGSLIFFIVETAVLCGLFYFADRQQNHRLLWIGAFLGVWIVAGILPYALSV